ncbi:MAG: hypothetical protein FJW20_05250 [Acidimicrobiia bacterium]|nr:hypothetical protein [Acidimicrobiia bacterium]
MTTFRKLIALCTILLPATSSAQIRPAINAPLFAGQSKIRAKVHALGEWKLQIKIKGTEAKDILTASATAENQGQLEFALSSVSADNAAAIKKLDDKYEGKLLAGWLVWVAGPSSSESDKVEVKANTVRILLQPPKEGDQVIKGAVIGSADQVRAEVFDPKGTLADFDTASVNAATATQPQQTFTAGMNRRLFAGQTVRVTALKDGGEIGATTDYALVETVGFDWGRVRAYFSAGATVANQDVDTNTAAGEKERKREFTSADYFLALNIDVNWHSTLPERYANPCGRPARAAEELKQLQETVDRWDGHDFDKRFPNFTSDNATPMERAEMVSLAVQALKAFQDVLTKAIENLESSLSNAECLASERAQITILKSHVGLFDMTSLGTSIGWSTAGYQTTQTIYNTYQEKLSTANNMRTIRTLLMARLENLDKALEEFARYDPSEVPGGWLLNTAFEARLAQAGVAGGRTAAAPEVLQLFQQSNSALIGVEIYAPKMPRWANWKFDGRENALFFAPLARFQVLATPTGPVKVDKDGRESPALFRRLHTMHSYGLRFGHFLLDPRRQTVAPELISFLDVALGQFTNFRRADRPVPWRAELGGRFKIPQSPFYIGFNANIGFKGKDDPATDDLRFFVGTRFDISKLLSRIVPRP